jgi:tetratricopeptide (TPR) repeat protein
MQLRSTYLVTLLLLVVLACGKTKKDPTGQKPDPELEKINQAIGKNPDNPELYFKRANLYYDRDGFDEAILDLNKALRYDSTETRYLHLLADVYLDYFKSYQALKVMEKAAQLHPERIPTLLKLSEFQQILKLYEPSMKTLDQILKLDPSNAEAYFMFGMNFKEVGDTARAINSFQTAVENDPDLIDGWINLGHLQSALGNKIAGQYYETATRIDPKNLNALHAKGYYLQSIGELKKSLQVFKKMAKVDPQYTDAYFNAGLLLMDLDSLPAAYEQFNQALQTSPVHIQSFYYRGLCAEMQGQKNQAKKDFEQALRLAPDYQKAKEALIRVGG